MSSETPISTFVSPKRKRSHDLGEDIPRSPMRLRTDLPSRPLETVPIETGSPRTRVAGQLQGLHLHNEHPIAQLDLHMEPQGYPDTMKDSEEERLGFSDIPNSNSAGVLNNATSTPIFTLTNDIPPNQSASNQLPFEILETTQPKIPATPTLKPSSPSTKRTISPLSSTRLKTPPRRSRSPPPNANPDVLSDLVWTASEITGHDPTDPTDDGYGINGIGFRPTAAMAYARTQRRKQQVAEWKSREAREARQRRSERRREESRELVGMGSDAGGRRVRFVEG